MKEHKLIQSYVVEKYFVSTVYRKSSALTESEIWYYETIVMEWDKEKQKTGKMLAQLDSGSHPRAAIDSHNQICAEFTNELMF